MKLEVEPSKEQPLIVIFAKNEQDTIMPIVDQCYSYSSNLLLISDSSDGTDRMASQRGVEVLRGSGLGKASSFGLFLRTVRLDKWPKVVLIDSDLEHDPSDLPTLFRELDDADIVQGNRFGKSSFPLKDSIAAFVFKRLTGVRIPDPRCGYMGLRTDRRLDFSLPCNHLLPMQLLLNNAGRSVRTVAISYHKATKRNHDNDYREFVELVKYYAPSWGYSNPKAFIEWALAQMNVTLDAARRAFAEGSSHVEEISPQIGQ